MALVKCPECGSDISDKAPVCPKCGYSIESTIQKKDAKKGLINKKIIIAIAVILLTAAASIIVLLRQNSNTPDSSGYYNNLKWGTPYEQIKEQLKAEFGDNAFYADEDKSISTITSDYGGKVGVRLLGLYDCKNDMLNKITLFITNSDESSYTDETLFNEEVQRLSETYGEYEKDIVTYVWRTEKSKIEIVYFSEGMIILTYEDITKAEE